MAITTNFDTAVLALVDDLVTADKVTLAEAIYESSFEVSKLAESHTVITGVRDGNVIPILSTAPQYNTFPYKNPTDCTVPVCDLDLGFGAKPWQLGMIGCRIPICINTFNDNFLAFWGQYKRVAGDADLNSALIQYIVDKFNVNLEAALWRVAFFGDRSTASGDANYSLLRPIDGIFTQAEAGDGTKILITQNNSGTAGAPVALPGEAVYAYLLQAYNTAVLEPWFNQATARFEMTAAMASALVGWLNGLGDRNGINCECYSADGITAMRAFNIDSDLRIFGIPIHVHREFDGVISALNLGFPYRALLTADTNILIGTSETDQLPDFRIWYSQDDNQIYIQGGAQVGASLVTNEYVYLGAEAL